MYYGEFENRECLAYVTAFTKTKLFLEGSFSTFSSKKCSPVHMNGHSEPPRVTVNIEYFMESARVRCLHGELWRIRNRTSERSERVRFLIQNNECVNTVQSTFHEVLCLLYTY